MTALVKEWILQSAARDSSSDILKLREEVVSYIT